MARAFAGLAVVAGALAACATTPTVTAIPTPTATTPVVTLAELDAEPAEHREESVAVAFDPDDASALLVEVPTDLDLASHAVVCVFLGARPSRGWSIELLTATLSGDVLTIRAREGSPRGGTAGGTTYPADCGLLTRGGLPAGELEVRAEDTVTGEFIAATVVEVPAASSAP
ncbi:MAG TPA: protease complex subunit PrcB family protein [Candidatus Limnocylindria bacterium]|nr:protease complex subunit PrcB family protein [Candidatus Limnocylindria bacterium]